MAIAPALLLSACGSGGSSETTASGNIHDGSTGASQRAISAVTAAVVPIGESSVEKLSHNAGLACGNALCHGSATMRAELRFTYAGTLNTTPSSSAPAAGQVIVVTDNTVDPTGVDLTKPAIEIVTDQNGNFYTTRGNPRGSYDAAGIYQPIDPAVDNSYAVTIKGTDRMMFTRPTDGSCGSVGCHGDTVNGGTFPIYLAFQ
jgi:hypothetical protein